MEIRENDKTCIFVPLSTNLDEKKTERLFKEISLTNKAVAIDLTYIQDCTYNFIDKIIELSQIKNLGIFNIPSDLFILFNIMDIDKHAHLFVSEQDFLTNSRQIINRKFSLI